jgi:hypothetical protein
VSILNPGGINSVQGLAGVIQGEAGSDPNEQFAVASTISNRLSGLFGNFGGSLSSVVSPTAFNGFSNTPNANATALASAIVNGNNLSSFGNPGNVTFFSASNFSTNPNAANFVNPSMQAVAGAGNTVSAGGNSFSGGTSAGPNLSGTILPQLGGSGGGNVLSGDFGGGAFDGESTGGGIATTAAATGGNSFTTNPDGSIDISQFDTPGQSVDFADVPDNLFDNSSVASPASVASTGAGVASGASSGAGAAAGAGGMPITITDLPGADTAITGAGTAVQKGATTAGSDVQTAAGGIAGTLASIINSVETFTSSAFVMVALVVLGAIFIAFGLGIFGKRQLEAVT